MIDGIELNGKFIIADADTDMFSLPAVYDALGSPEGKEPGYWYSSEDYKAAAARFGEYAIFIDSVLYAPYALTWAYISWVEDRPMPEPLTVTLARVMCNIANAIEPLGVEPGAHYRIEVMFDEESDGVVVLQKEGHYHFSVVVKAYREGDDRRDDDHTGE